MTWFFLILALIAGAFLPLQAGINAQLRSYAGHPVIAAFISFFVGTAVLFFVALALRLQWPSFAGFASAPWWIWIGGAMGAFLVFLTLLLADRLGAMVLVSFIIAGQMIASIIMDHYGLAGYPRRPINPNRIMGAELLISGVILIRFK